MKKCILMRGVPGSGKSYEARRIADNAVANGQTATILSTDNYFMTEENGELVYKFNGDEIVRAHAWNERQVEEAMRKGFDVVIVDNTHTRPRECYATVDLAFNYDYEIEFLESSSPWWLAAREALRGKRNEKTLAPHVKVFAAKNTHNVPEQAIFKMLNRYHLNVTVEDVLNAA